MINIDKYKNVIYIFIMESCKDLGMNIHLEFG